MENVMHREGGMTRKAAHAGTGAGKRIQTVGLTVAATVVVAGMVTLAVGGRPHSRHLEPRPGVTAEHVMHGANVPHAAGAAETYAVARAMPAVLDGLHCYCACSISLGHRSLLSCFEDEHGAFCKVCQDEALIAEAVTARGGSLAQVREAVDARFGPPT